MKISELAAMSGKGGLFKVLAPTKSGVILESLDESKTKVIATTNNRLSMLHEISIYTHSQEGTEPLENVLRKIHSEYKGDPGIDADTSPDELRAFLKTVVADFDQERVYPSDIKKLVRWYNIILRHAPEILEEPVAAENTDSTDEVAQPTGKEVETKQEAPAEKADTPKKKSKAEGNKGKGKSKKD